VNRVDFIGTHDGRPRYIERNKERGGAFEHVVPAQIVYCRGIEAWVFKHENIRTSLEVDNEVGTAFSLLFLHVQISHCC